MFVFPIHSVLSSLRSSSSLQRVKKTVRAAEINDPVCHQWGREDRADGKLPIGRHERRLPPAVEEQERDVESSFRGQDPVCVLLRLLGLKFPKQLAGVTIARFESAVQDPDKDDIVRDRG